MIEALVVPESTVATKVSLLSEFQIMPHLRKYKFPGAVYNDAVTMIRVFVYER